ncbi:hypothetical protein EYE42_04880 [Paracoccus subflavus]|uniref:Uncharacterized protein n=1 Tax=Paracoccus subflavus TaxID=2528244 RepID=A0A4V2JCP4_9RHOB|nr:hypothetical protein [Paracoccus subflavus]TBN42758.1 hypothetical protein EYE42_04880 [Paracoccus subflavus]
MFNRIATALRSARPVAALPCVAGSETSMALRTELETIFRADMDSFTRIALDHRARKAAALAA